MIKVTDRLHLRQFIWQIHRVTLLFKDLTYLIDYCDASYDIPGSIILLDIEKAFDSVEHDYLFEVIQSAHH